jgi:hypothetical protein
MYLELEIPGFGGVLVVPASNPSYQGLHQEDLGLRPAGANCSQDPNPKITRGGQKKKEISDFEP